MPGPLGPKLLLSRRRAVAQPPGDDPGRLHHQRGGPAHRGAHPGAVADDADRRHDLAVPAPDRRAHRDDAQVPFLVVLRPAALATAASSASSRFLSVMVHGVWATGRQSASRRVSSSGGSAASRTFPELVQCAGSRCPTWRKIGSMLWLSSRSTYTTSSPSSTATCTISPVSCRSVASTGSAAWCRSTCSVTLLPSSYRTRPRRYRPGVLPRSSSRSAVSVVTSRCTVLLPRPSWRESSVMPSS